MFEEMFYQVTPIIMLFMFLSWAFDMFNEWIKVRRRK